MKFTVNRHIKWILLHTLFLLLIFTIYRVFLFKAFDTNSTVFSWDVLWYGLRYDIRTIFVILLPVYFVSGFFALSPFHKKSAFRFWTVYLTICNGIVLLAFVLDYNWYAYRSNRLDGEMIALAQETKIGFQMVWQSYPVLKILLGIVIGIVLLYKIVKWLNLQASFFTPVQYNPHKTIFSIIFFFIMSFCIYGKFSKFPLRWSDAFSMNNDFKANMALNPFQSFLSSLQFKDEQPDINKVKKYYPYLASALQLPASDSIQFKRHYEGNPGNQPNIVLVICESFSYYKSSMTGSPIDPTPYFNSLTKEGIFFSNCFTPAYGTARGVWATITGIPDVAMVRTSTRIPRAVKQHTIVDDFDGYEKFYFIGGNATWANIRGLIKNNIRDLHLYEQGDYSSPSVDVWGITDNDLFKEANKILSKQNKPFFSIIQTASNHRPYTIPHSDAQAMGLKKYALDTLVKYGFNVEKNESKTNEEYNSMRYMDFAIKNFMEAAKKQPWYQNTIFLFVGDHGIRGNGKDLIPKVYTTRGLTCQHVPLLIYSPLLKSAYYDFPCSQVDVLPTLAGLANIQYNNTTLGRDLLKIANDTAAPKFAFILDHDLKQYGIMADNQFYYKKLNDGSSGIEKVDPLKTSKTPLSYYENLAEAIYSTSRYWMFNNK